MKEMIARVGDILTQNGIGSICLTGEEIVRCKDCVNYKIRPEFRNEKYALGRCDNISYLVGPYWFCADGKINL